MNKKRWTIWTLAILIIVFPALTSQVLAKHSYASSDITVEIISEERGVLPKYAAGLSKIQVQRNYVVARNDEHYRIRVHNRSNERVGLVIAVDGRNIISGRQSHLKSHERMYILGPYQTGDYEGWRTGRNRVNRFYFTGLSDSYAAAWDDYSATGVIAVAAYKNKRQDTYSRKKYQKNKRLDRPQARGWREDPGTGFGETEWSPSRTVQFTPQKHPFSREFVKYEWYSTLCKRGIVSCREKKQRHKNRFWPEHRHEFGFAPFPPFWPLR